MSRLFQICTVMSVISSFAYGASISHVDGFSFSKQQKVNTHIHTITDLANGFWNEIPSKMYMGLDKAKSIEDTLASKTFLNNADPIMNEDSTAKSADSEKVLASVFITSSTVNMATNESHNSKNGSQINTTFILPSITSFEEDGEAYECEETGASCFTWKILKTVGASVGAGFIVGLFSPVLFYFIITTLGCLSYGMYKHEHILL